MSDRVDIQELKRSVNIVDVIGKYLSLQKRGHEHYAMCCFHDDHKASLMVNEQKQVYKCFACGSGGDSIDFLTRKGRTMPEAIQELQGYTPVPSISPHSNKKEEWKQVIPTEEPAFDIVHYQHGKPSGIWRYTDLYGKLIGFVCRFDLPEGKQILPHTLRYNGKHYRWMWKGFDKPRPLYNQNTLLNNPEKSILIVEGEKTCDAAIKIFPDFNCITWMGGAKAYESTDWSLLKGEDVFLWPDNDEPGIKAMHDIGCIALKVGAKRVYIVKLSKNIPEHWDLADSTNPEKARQYLTKNWDQFKPELCH